MRKKPAKKWENVPPASGWLKRSTINKYTYIYIYIFIFIIIIFRKGILSFLIPSAPSASPPKQGLFGSQSIWWRWPRSGQRCCFRQSAARSQKDRSQRCGRQSRWGMETATWQNCWFFASSCKLKLKKRTRFPAESSVAAGTRLCFKIIGPEKKWSCQY